MRAPFRKPDAPLFPPAESVAGMKLQVSANRRHFVTDAGRPFLYLADTAWQLFKRLNREEVELYLRNRAAKGFTAVQAYMLRGLETPNLYGERTLVDGDPTRPNEAFFENVDFIVNRANELGLVMGIVTNAGGHVRGGSAEQVIDESNAHAYGRFLGERYRDNAVVWFMGGDKQPIGYEATWSALARGLKDGSGGAHLVSYHGPGPAPGVVGYSSSFWFHDADWCDFNTIQSSHAWGTLNFEFITHDYELTPPKPTLDMETRYESHPPIYNWTAGKRRIDAHQVREAAYWNVLAGAAGNGYGAWEIWPLWDADMPRLATVDEYYLRGDLHCATNWREAMDYEGAFSMGRLRQLFELRPWHQMAPDQRLLASLQGVLEDHVQCARAEDGSFALAYTPFGSPFSIRMDRIAGGPVIAHWYDPRDGTWRPAGEYKNEGTQEFTPPTSGEQEDWLLVLDSAAACLPVP
jgi:hypothetical protein